MNASGQRLLLCFLLSSSLSFAALAVSPNDTARLMAGLPAAPGSPLESLAAEAGWQSTAAQFEGAWKRLESSRLAPARDWANANLAQVRSQMPVLYYAFSGPDFLYAGTLFPHCKTYVLCGLEPVGPIPALEALPATQAVASIRQLHASLDSILSLSFFRTKDMKTDLRSHALQGTTPILFTFLSRLGKSLESATLLSLDKQGDITPLDSALTGITPNGLRIVFNSGPETPSQTLYYFSADISNSGMKAHPGFPLFCKKLEHGAGLVKAASYLMHETYFSDIRDLLLERCALILQDDSGIPLAKFPTQDWEIHPYGRYLGPIALFKERYQPELEQLYASAPPGPLPFGIGYRHRSNESNLVLFLRKNELVKVSAPAAAEENGNH